MSTNAPTVKRPPHLQTPRGVQLAVHDVIEDALQMLHSLFNSLFTNVDDYFFDQANKADGSIQQVRLFDAMRVARLHRSDISGRFFSGLSSDIKKTWPVSEKSAEPDERKASLKAINFDEISIQSDAQAEISAAKTVIASRGYIDCGHRHATLRATLNAIFDTRDVTETMSPIGLTGLTDRFCDSLDALSLDNSVVLSFLTLFEREVVARLGEVYSHALAELEGLNVVVVDPDDHGGTGSKVDGVRSKASDVTMPFSELQRHLGRSDPERGPRRLGSAVTAQSDPVQLVDSLRDAHGRYLDQLSKGSVPATGIPSLQTFLHAAPLGDNVLHHAGSDELDVVRLVSHLFDYIFSNTNGSLPCRELLARLQFPVLAMAILDKSFFSEADHPARLFLNRLAHDGIGWPVSEKALRKNRFYLAAEALVQGITDAFPEISRVLFSQALERWEGLGARKRHQTEVAERRINESVLGQARLNAARRIVEREVNVAAGHELPSTVVTFIADTWFHVMVMICMKYGTDSDQWIEAKDVYRDLVDVSRIGRGGRSAETGAVVADLMARLGKGLELSGRVDTRIWKAMGDLERTVQVSLVSASATSECDKPELTIMQPVKLSDGDEAKDAARVDQKLAGLLPGTWIEIAQDGEAHPLRCRLVVMVDQTQTFVFANDEGRKVYESAAADLLQDLEAGRIRVLDEEPLVDRAMGELLQSLTGYR